MTADLKRRSALAGVPLPAGAAARPFLAQVGLRLDPADAALRGRVESALGVTLPLAANTVTGDAAGRHILWLGPDEWLVVGPDGSAAAIEAAILGAAAGGFVTATDLSANRIAIELAGAHARELLESGMPLDLHPRAFRAGSCAQTILGRFGVIVHQLTDAPSYRIWVRPSFAGSLAAWLTDAAIGLPRD